MTQLMNKLRTALEDGIEVARNNAQNLKELTEEYSKVARLRFNLYQLQNARRKKLEFLGDTVYPYLLENNVDGLKKHETLQIVLDDIKNLENDIELTRKAIRRHTSKSKSETTSSEEIDHEEMQKQIGKLEEEIEQRLEELKIVKEAINKKK
ncbi:MAG: hypothetical protein GF313_11630 [Caldithrix sp.]|nr:hypothetical protein [Caldithrix sp.]